MDSARRQASTWWVLARMVLVVLVAVGLTYGLNRFVHDTYVTHSAPQQSLRVLTWNVGKIYLPWESRVQDRDLGHVARVIRELAPHVVALQEMRDAEQLGRLVAMLGSGWRGKIPMDVYDRRAALLVRVQGRFFELPTGSGRVAQGVRLTLSDGNQVALVSLHLDAFDSRRRLEQAEEILAGLREHAADATVVLGDCNFDPTVAGTDAMDMRTYSLLTASHEDVGREAGATTIFSRRLDYVLVSPPGRFATHAFVVRGKRINTMDHDLLVADISDTGSAPKR